MAIETLHVREALVPGLSARDLERQSFYELLLGRYGVDVVGGLQTIEPTVTNETESEALGVPLHSPAFLFERTTRSSTGEIVEYVRSIYRGDRYKLVTELNRGSGRRPGNGNATRRSLLVSTRFADEGSSPSRDPRCNCVRNKVVLTTRRSVCQCSEPWPSGISQ